MTYGVLETVRSNPRPFQVRTKDEIYPFATWDSRAAFIAAEGIEVIDRGRFDRLANSAAGYDESALILPPAGRDDPAVVEAKAIAREQTELLDRACGPARVWWRDVSQANGHKLGLLLKLVRGLRQLDRRHRAGGGLLPVDWINEARSVASDAGLLDPAEWIDRIERRHLFEEQ